MLLIECSRTFSGLDHCRPLREVAVVGFPSWVQLTCEQRETVLRGRYARDVRSSAGSSPHPPLSIPGDDLETKSTNDEATGKSIKWFQAQSVVPHLSETKHALG